MAVAGEVIVAELVGHDEEDVFFVLGHGFGFRRNIEVL